MQLHFTPRTQNDTQLCHVAFEDFYYEWNAEFGCFCFPEDEDSIDDLERALTELTIEFDINGYFEAE